MSILIRNVQIKVNPIEEGPRSLLLPANRLQQRCLDSMCKPTIFPLGSHIGERLCFHHLSCFPKTNKATVRFVPEAHANGFQACADRHCVRELDLRSSPEGGNEIVARNHRKQMMEMEKYYQAKYQTLKLFARLQ